MKEERYLSKFVQGFLNKLINLNPILRVLLMPILEKKKYYNKCKEISDPTKTYWISSDRINHVTNFQKKTLLVNEVSNERKSVKVVDGNWDKASLNLVELSVYKHIKQIIEDEQSNSTDLFKRVLKESKSLKRFWSPSNISNLEKILKNFNSKQSSYICGADSLTQGTRFEFDCDDEIRVNIGRNGEYLIQNNICLQSVAKILGIKSIPVKVFTRHKQWQDFRDFVIKYIYSRMNGFLYQPIVHPDFVDFPYQYDVKCKETMEAIKSHLTRENGIMVDLGANIGFYCHKFEDLGYQCYAIENDIDNFKILKKIRDSEKKTFVAINKSVFETELLKTKQFDVVLALNLFHHFLKTKQLFYKLKELLRNLKTDLMFFSTAGYEEEQMRNAFQNFSESRFVEFILEHTDLSMSESIFSGRMKRHVYKLSK